MYKRQLYKLHGDFAKAQPLYERALQLRESLLGPMHPDVGMSYLNLGSLYRDQGQLDLTELFWTQALAVFQGSLPAGHPQIQHCMFWLQHLQMQRVMQFGMQ